LKLKGTNRKFMKVKSEKGNLVKIIYIYKKKIQWKSVLWTLAIWSEIAILQLLQIRREATKRRWKNCKSHSIFEDEVLVASNE
jgi:hypothetical protein